jgi:hypothetical protein
MFTTRHRLVACLVSLLPILTYAQEHSNAFHLQLLSDIKLGGSLGDTHMNTDTQIQYTWQVNGHDRTLIYDQTSVRINQNGKEIMNMEMDKNSFSMKQDGKETKMSLDQAPPQLKTMLEESYGKPLYRITIDDNGKETGRKDLASAGAKDLMDNGGVANATLMHLPYYSDRKEWKAQATVSMGNGGYAKGDLTFTRAADENGLPTYDVSGTLANDSFSAPGSPITQKDVKYVVKGKESYDPKIREWVHGDWTADVTGKMLANQKQIGTMQGTMQIKMHRVGEGKR